MHITAARVPTEFYLLPAPVRHVAVENGYVTGIWESPFPKEYKDALPDRRPAPSPWPPQLRKPGEVITDFVNAHGGDDAVIWFTRKYGPLEVEAREGGRFKFQIQEWRNFQAKLQSEWKFIASGKWRELGGIVHRIPARLGDTRFRDVIEGRLFERITMLCDYLNLDFCSLELKRVKLCAWRGPECITPYFIAQGDLRQKYCSLECAHEATKKSIRESVARARNRARLATSTAARKKNSSESKLIRSISRAPKQRKRK